jgi:hypothetical protein
LKKLLHFENLDWLLQILYETTNTRAEAGPVAEAM